MPKFNIQFQHHDISKFPQGPRKGRVPLDGTFAAVDSVGNVIQLCEQDPEFRRRIRLRKADVVSPHNLVNLFMLTAFYLPKLPMGYRGVRQYKGGRRVLAYLAQRFLPGAVYAFDTFGGMPATDAAIDVHKAGIRDVSSTHPPGGRLLRLTTSISCPVDSKIRQRGR